MSQYMYLVFVMSCVLVTVLEGGETVEDDRAVATGGGGEEGDNEANRVLRRALKDTPRAHEMNDLDDSAFGQNFPLRPYKMSNLTDILAVEWTCNSSFSKNKEGLGPEEGCNCVRQLVREGGDDNFEDCCDKIWIWMQNVKKDKNKVKKIMFFAPSEAQRSAEGEETATKSPTAEFFDMYQEKAENCMAGKDFGDLRTDKLGGLNLNPSQILITLLAMMAMMGGFGIKQEI